MKNGLYLENGVLVYYKNDAPCHAGVVKVDDKIYYISRGGKAVTGRHIVHSEMSNGILKRGTYTFGDDGVLINGSYIPPKKRRKSILEKLSIKKTDNKIKKLIILVFVVVATLLMLSLAVTVFDVVISGGEFDDTTSGQQTKPTTDIRLPEFTEPVLLCSNGAYAFHNGEITMEVAVETGTPYKPFVFEFDLYGKSGILYLSDVPDLSNAKEYILSIDSTQVVIDNLKTGVQYYYKVVVDGTEYPGGFRTAVAPRFVSIPGVYNTRDVGGCTTLDGRRIKQNMIIRGSEIDGLIQPQYFLADEDVEEVMNTFGFVYDFDLREESLFVGEYSSRLGEKVRHKFYTSPGYGGIFGSQAKLTLVEIFSDLAKPENYPMYLHCTYGADRTGTIVFLLQGILNVPEDEMHREYQRTAYFRHDTVTSANLEPIYAVLENVEGDTIQEKIVNFLINDVGVPQSDIDAIRNILLE